MRGWIILKLSDRLKTVIDLVGDGSRILDVGTDHGYVPTYFALSGRASRVAASDVRKEPLKRAMITAERYGMADSIEFFMSDGLTGIDREFDDIIIAGMGGEAIISILADAPWTRGAHLVLQPQSKQETLCSWLAVNGYGPLDARLAEDDGKLYQIMSVTGGNTRGQPFEEFIIRPLLKRADALLPKYLSFLRARTERAIQGMERGGADTSAEKRLLRDIAVWESAYKNGNYT